MKRILIVILILSLVVNGYAQNRKKTAPAKKLTTEQMIESAQDAIVSYRFENAIELLEEAKTALARKKKSTAEVEDLLDKAEFGLRMLHGTDQILVVDTFVVDKADFLSAYKLSEETGTLDYFSHFFKTAEGEGTIFQTELGNRVYFSKLSGESQKIFSSNLLAGNQWSEAQELEGIGDEYTSENYPFVTSDGSTLYFASKGAENGLGGYDIYVTRISNSSHYLRPENLGYPYNSPYNDYMFVLDEFNHLGWFASDRFQPEDKVCLYVFVPNESRTPYLIDEDDAELIRHGALLDQIKSTQTDQARLSTGRASLQAALTYKPKAVKTKDFVLVIDDERMYTTYSQFKNPQAKSLCQEWVKKQGELTLLETSLENNRQQYAAGNKQLAEKILQQETQVEHLQLEVKNLEVKTRNTELAK
ncbi:MAG: PD40 domain-containing protein [Bacteroidaceae bacterium]|nr:PD40 domain-containing protein [Bacteroidaceae bacterium]